MRVFGRQIEYKWIVAVVYVSALFLDILDSTIVNVAIPGLGRELHTENAEWVVLGYTLSLAVWIPTSGWLGDRFGTKRTFLIAPMAFTGGHCSVVAQNDRPADRLPCHSGRGGGMLTPVGLAMLFRSHSSYWDDLSERHRSTSNRFVRFWRRRRGNRDPYDYAC